MNPRQLINQLRVAYFMPQRPVVSDYRFVYGIHQQGYCTSPAVAPRDGDYATNYTLSFKVPYVPFGVVGGRNSLRSGTQFRMQMVGGLRGDTFCQPNIKFFPTYGGAALGDYNFGKGYKFVYNEAEQTAHWPYYNDFAKRICTRIFF